MECEQLTEIEDYTYTGNCRELPVKSILLLHTTFSEYKILTQNLSQLTYFRTDLKAE